MPRISLREMFVLVAAVALAIVSLVYASSLLQAAVSLIALLVGLAAVILGIIDCGPRRAFAIGFSVAMIGYLVVVLNCQRMAAQQTNQFVFETNRPHLPTWLLLDYFYEGINRSGNYDVITNELIPESEKLVQVPGTMGGAKQTGAGHGVWYQELPPREIYMATGHLWWALLFGYIGGHFARFIYKRRAAEQPSQQ